MKKVVCTISLISTVSVFGFTFDEYKKMCEENNNVVVSVSANNQTEYQAIEAARATGQVRILEQYSGTNIDSESFLAKAYRKINGVEQLTKDQVTMITSKANGLVLSKDAKEPKFFKNGKVDKNGEDLGKARVWLKRNCSSPFLYRKFLSEL